MRTLLVAVLLSLLTACGYHLRGSLQLPQELKKVYLLGGSANLQKQFQKTLENSSGQLVKTPGEAAMTVRVFEKEIRQRAISLSGQGRSNQFELYYLMFFELRDSKNKVLTEREKIEIRREYFNDQQDIIAKDNEESVIRNEMYQQAVRTILNRMRVVFDTAKTKS